MKRVFRQTADTFTSFFNVSNWQLCKFIERNEITCIQRLVFFKPFRWISRHSLHHNLVWNVTWALVFSFTLFSNYCFIKMPIISILFIHFVIISFSCFPFLLKVVVFFLWWIFVSHVLLDGFSLLSNFFK